MLKERSNEKLSHLQRWAKGFQSGSNLFGMLHPGDYWEADNFTNSCAKDHAFWIGIGLTMNKHRNLSGLNQRLKRRATTSSFMIVFDKCCPVNVSWEVSSIYNFFLCYKWAWSGHKTADSLSQRPYQICHPKSLRDVITNSDFNEQSENSLEIIKLLSKQD